jgi:hypothetical protein
MGALKEKMMVNCLSNTSDFTFNSSLLNYKCFKTGVVFDKNNLLLKVPTIFLILKGTFNFHINLWQKGQWRYGEDGGQKGQWRYGDQFLTGRT